MFGCKRLFGIEEPILIVSAYNDSYAHLNKISAASYRKYVAHFGGKYEYRNYVIPGEYDRAPSWFKIDLLIDLCKERTGTIWWVDTDTVVTKFAELPDHGKVFNFCFTEVFNGINCGVFAIKSCEKTVAMLEKIRSQTQFLDHNWWEQAAIHHLYYQTKEFLPYCKTIDNSVLNSFEMSVYGRSPLESGQITEKTIIAHFPGPDYQTKLRLMEQYSI